MEDAIAPYSPACRRSALADIFLSVALRYKKGVHFAHPFMIAIINRYCKSLFDTAERYTAYDIP